MLPLLNLKHAFRDAHTSAELLLKTLLHTGDIMPNLAFHLEVLKLVTKKLAGTSQADFMAKHKKYAALGAMGPDLLRYLPVSKSLADGLANLASQPFLQGVVTTLPEFTELARKPLGGAYSVLFRHLVIPTWPVLNRIKAFLDQMDLIVSTKNLLALPSMMTQSNTIQAELAALQGKFSPGLISVLSQIAAIPPAMQVDYVQLGLPPSVAQFMTQAVFNRPFEFLRWHKTGAFAKRLVSNATTDERKAYAYGYLSHFAASVTGEPFVNNIVGGPRRLHWKRWELVAGFVDSWTYGFYNTKGAKMDGDEPTPPYARWKPLCSANIQEEFNIAGFAGSKGFDVPDAVKAVASGDLGNLPTQFPSNLKSFLQDSVNQTYTFVQPQELKDFDKALVSAHAFWWFMTSGSGPMCNNPVGPPPPGCTSAPSWVTAPPGSVGALLQQAGLNLGATTCAVLLAMSSLFLILTGNITLGIIALILALNQPIIDWDKVRCHLYWLRKLYADAGNLLRDALVRAGFGFQPSWKLGTIDLNGKTQPVNDYTIGPGVPLCRTNNKLPSGTYPKSMDATLGTPDFNYSSFPPPTVLLETANVPAENLIPGDLYPNHVVDESPPPSGGGMMSDPANPPLSNHTFFGDAVSNAVEVIKANALGLQDFNLDADRGYGWKTWRPTFGSFPAVPPVSVDKE
jgi:hypothetical protein